MTPKVAILDADHLLYVVTHCKKIKDSEGKDVIDDLGNFVTEVKTLEQVKGEADAYIIGVLNAVEATHYIGALTIGKNFRYDVFPEYKANRVGRPKPQYFKELRQHLIDKWEFIHHSYCESDDICNIYKKKLGEEGIIISPDIDMLMLEGVHYDPRTGGLVNTTKQEAYYKFWYDMIVGQTGDSIKGLKGKGPVYATNRLKELDETEYRQEVLNDYCEHYGEYKGILEFTKNYQLLYILDSYDGFEFIEPIPFNAKDEFQKRITERAGLGD